MAKKDLGPLTSLLAAASLVVDYVLTVAVSLAAGAASLASVFPALAHHLLAVCLIGLVVLTVLNLIGIAESAKALMLPTLLFIVCILTVVGLGLFRAHPVAAIGTDLGPVHATEALGVVLILKAFAAGCSALTGVEAIANGVPAFRQPAVKRAQRTELALGILLAVMLLGLAVLIKIHHVVPRGNVTVLAQLSAAAFGTGWPFYVTNITVTLVLGFAANTSFGGLPVLMNLLAKDNRLPHLFSLRAERPVFRYGVSALALLAAVLLIVTDADTNRLLPLFAIGVFIGFTISQAGLVRHWRRRRTPGWLPRALLNATGAVLTAIAAVVFMASKFLEGAWTLLLIVPALVLLFARIEHYYRNVGEQIGLDLALAAKPFRRSRALARAGGPLGERLTGQSLPPPHLPAAGAGQHGLVIVPIGDVSRVSRLALETAHRLGGTVIPVAVQIDPEATERLCDRWQRWNPGVDLRVLPSPHRKLGHPSSATSGSTSTRARTSPSCSPRSNPASAATRSCTTSAGSSSPPHCAPAPTRSSPRSHFA